MSTKIEWCDETLNPLGWGCYGPGGTPEKPAVCQGCYAKAWASKGLRKCPDCAAFRPHWHPEQLLKPLYWKKHRSIFWQDMGDLWHPETRPEPILLVMDTVLKCPQHMHLFLTKNPSRYIEYYKGAHFSLIPLPIDNAFYGVTVRNQEEANRLVPILLEFADLGFKVFISYEPALGPVDLFNKIIANHPVEVINDVVYNVRQSTKVTKYTGQKGNEHPLYPGQAVVNFSSHPGLSGVIAGGMTGTWAMPAHPDWFRSVREQCAVAGVPFFFKGWGEWKAAADPKEGLEFLKQARDPKCCQAQGSSLLLYNIGRKASGRILNGRTHDALPWKVNK